MPADLTTLVACQRAAAHLGSKEDTRLGPFGPAAAAPIASVYVAIRFLRRPVGGVPFKESVSAGTMASIVEILKDPEARLVGQPESLLPRDFAQHRRKQPAPLNLWPLVKANRVFGPVVPVAFLDPPVVHRTAAILASERGTPVDFSAYREGVDLGASTGSGSLRRRLAATLKGLTQMLMVRVMRLPRPLRAGIARLLTKFLPAAGSGPSGRYLTDWEWQVEATQQPRTA